MIGKYSSLIEQKDGIPSTMENKWYWNDGQIGKWITNVSVSEFSEWIVGIELYNLIIDDVSTELKSLKYSLN